ncbi:MAG: threonine synthase [Clostridiales bacterium]|nr:threonine synthase [Clostridiales bacterium]
MMWLRCVSCGKTYQPEKGRYTCDDCGPLHGTMEVLYEYEDIKLTRDDFSKTGSIFQFDDLLPVKGYTPIDHAIGSTPLLAFNHTPHVERLLIKNDGVNMSGSYKDRASVIAMNMAIKQGYDTIYCASTGNAASSLALLTAHSKLKTVIFVPKSAPAGKLAQLMAAGVTLHVIDGTYDEAFDVAYQVGEKHGWYCRNSAINPYLLEGKKTAAFEILVQNDYRVPDYCLVSVGDGTVISSLIKGFEEFVKVGLVSDVPTVIGVQAEGAATLKHVFDAGKPYKPLQEATHTIADSISVGNPRDVIKACQFIERNGGDLVTVTDDEIVSAIVEMTTLTGVFAEPAGAAPFAALKNLALSGRIKPEDQVVLVVTGNGLKDTSSLKTGTIELIGVDEALETL